KARSGSSARLTDSPLSPPPGIPNEPKKSNAFNITSLPAEQPSTGGFFHQPHSTPRSMFRQPAIAFLDRRLGLLQSARRIFRPGPPVSPAHQVFLELQPRPAVVPIGQEHPSVQVVQV